ncbi:MAG: hypothetical protein K8U57_17420 [Planctomycetes bacterium]|nr:hypothetical protein [Planctomycetota bacterium]
MRLPPNRPSYRRTILACVAIAASIGLPVALYEGKRESRIVPAAAQDAVFFEVAFFVLLLFTVIGGVFGSVVYLARTISNGSPR